MAGRSQKCCLAGGEGRTSLAGPSSLLVRGVKHGQRTAATTGGAAFGSSHLGMARICCESRAGVRIFRSSKSLRICINKAPRGNCKGR